MRSIPDFHHKKSLESQPTAELGLTEVVIGVLIMVPLLVMLLGVFLRSVRGTVETWDETKAVASAQRMMDQIRAARWDEATPPAGGFIPAGSATLGPESTQAFNDVDDWNGFTGADPLPGHGQFTRTVTVQYVNISGAGNVTVVSSTSSYKRVTVQVTRRSGGPVTITRIIANANP